MTEQSVYTHTHTHARTHAHIRTHTHTQTHTQATDWAKELIGGLADPKATGVVVEVLEVEGQSKVGETLTPVYAQCLIRCVCLYVHVFRLLMEL